MATKGHTRYHEKIIFVSVYDFFASVLKQTVTNDYSLFNFNMLR